MSTDTVFARKESRDFEGEATPNYRQQPGNTRSSGGNELVQKVWFAPMSEAGEWVATWTRVPGAVAYEVQTSSDGGQWGSASKFSGTRAVLLLGPTPRCWVRVRAIGPRGPAEWSEPKLGKKAPSD